MSENSSPTDERASSGMTRRPTWLVPILWAVAHVLLLVIAFAARPVKIDPDLFSILPPTSPSKAVADAERALAARMNSGLYVLVGHADFAEARKLAVELADAISGFPDVDEATCEVGSGYLDGARDFLFRYRYAIQGDETIARLERGEGAAMAEEALATAFSPFTLSSLSRLDEDPFLLTEASFSSLASSALLGGLAIAPRDGVLAAEDGGIHYVLISVSAPQAASSLDVDGHVVARILDAEKRLSAATPGVRFANSGVPFHSFESTRETQREIAMISVASLVATILLLVLVYRSPTPLLATVLAIAIGAAEAFAATLLAFGEVHVLTLAFGTSLIGVSVDYALHFFTERASLGPTVNGLAVRSRVIRGVWLGLATTLVSYAVLFIAPFPLLRQMALFSTVGLVSVFSAVAFIFPRTPAPRKADATLPLRLPSFVLSMAGRFACAPLRVKLLIAFAFVAVASPGFLRVRVDNDVRGLYTMSAAMRESEAIAARVLRHGSSGWYYIVSGESAEGVLRAEESLSARLAEEVSAGRLGTFLGTTRFLPSFERQRKLTGLISRELMPRASDQLAALGFGPAELARLEADFARSAANPLTPEILLSEPFARSISTFWIGEIDGRWYSAVMPLRATDKEAFRRLADPSSGTYFVDKTGDISATLGRISTVSLALLAVSYLVILALLTPIYGIARAIRISLAPVSAALLTVSALGLLGEPLNLFSVMGIVMTMGIGIDYAIFLSEGTTHPPVTMLAVCLSMLTTVLSFGFLSFSSLAPVHTFGVTVFIGVALSFVLAPLFAGRASCGAKG